MRRFAPPIAWLVLDVSIVAAASFVAYWLRFDGPPPAPFAAHATTYTLISIGVYAAALAAASLYRPLLRFAGIETFSALAGAVIVAGGSMFLVVSVSQARQLIDVPRSLPALQALFVFAAAAAWRVAARMPEVIPFQLHRSGRRVAVVGAGSAAALLIRDIMMQPDLGLRIVCALDDDRAKIGRTIMGVPVVGTTQDLSVKTAEHRVEEVFIAMPSAEFEARRRVVDACAEAGVKARIVHGMTGPIGIASLDDVSIEDLLGRDTVMIEDGPARRCVQGAVVAVTGAAGSIGSELCRQLLVLRPASILLIDIDESRLYELILELQAISPQTRVELCLVDVRDPSAVRRLLRRFRPQLLFHAAAYKHVPIMEEWPCEAYKANVGGTWTLLDECREAGVERFILVSTDKAVDPMNHMGLSKAIAELCVLHHAAEGFDATTVRFGNVLGSRGSVIPLFEQQLRGGGPLLVTHPDVTRYFMTIPEAARLVLQTAAMEGRGRIYVLEMGEPVRVVDVARKIISLTDSRARIEFIGLRPGEKLHERLSTPQDALVPSAVPGVLELVARPLMHDDFPELVSEIVEVARAGDQSALRPLLRRAVGLPLEWLDKAQVDDRTVGSDVPGSTRDVQ